MNTFPNNATRAVFTHVLADWTEDGAAAALATEWEDIGQGSAEQCLADQLKREWHETYLDCGDDVSTVLVRYGLKQVKWLEVARRLLAFARVRTEDKPDGEPPADVA